MAKVQEAHKEVNEEKLSHTAVVEHHSAPVAVYDESLDYDTHAYDKIRPQDVSQPHFKLLQSGSAVTKRNQPEYVPGAEEGMWFDTVRKEVYKELLVVLVDFRTTFLEWKFPSVKTGGFIRDHGPQRPPGKWVKVEGRQAELYLSPAKDSQIVETAVRYGLVVGYKKPGDEEWTLGVCRPAIFSFANTGMKAGKHWLDDLRNIEDKRPDGTVRGVAPWAQCYRLSSVGDSNNQGSWSRPIVDRDRPRRELPNAEIVGKTAFTQQKILEDEFAVIVIKDDEAAQGEEPKSPF